MSGHEILKVVRERRGASIASRIPPGALLGGDEDFLDGSMGGGGLVMRPEDEADVAQIEYLKIAGCYVLDRESEIVDELKRLVKKVVL